jgi:trehalose 6-phosphate synthase/phosphatase
MSILILSNRLPITVRTERGEVVTAASAGGLATALAGPHRQAGGWWLGWPGDVSRLSAEQRARLDAILEALHAVPVHLTAGEVNRYYEGFSNGVLWPLYHYLTDRVERHAWKNWETYVEVNRRFAEAAARRYQPGQRIWVHDYQLSLVPGFLRRLLPRARIGYFLHIPFPSSEVFRILPWRREILEGMLGADLVGFHTYSYGRHFARSVRAVLGLDSEGDRVLYGGRQVSFGAFPIGIDAAEFEALAGRPEVLAEVEAMRRQTAGQKLILGVDRLDYTKGLLRRLLAFQRLLEREPSWRGKVRLVQVAVPSRSGVATYQDHRRQLDELVGRINGEYGTVRWTPISYLYRCLARQDLVALYRAADVMLVTPLRDGMNLVAKEFVASRPDADGVLVLSEFAGASAELAEALVVNPYDLDGVAAALKQALTMPEEERRTRMLALRRRVAEADCYSWAGGFLQALDAVPAPSEEPGPSRPEEMARVLEALRRAPRVLLLLDYDGTLVEFAPSPELASPDRELRELLAGLAGSGRFEVHVVSGRSRETLQRWLGALPLGLHAEHGFWQRAPGGEWRALAGSQEEWKQRLLPLLRRRAAATPGSLVEEKSAGLAWHYRRADPEQGAEQARRLQADLAPAVQDLPVEILSGSQVVEVRLRGVHKGLVVAGLLQERPGPFTLVCLGDDPTDEDMFAALPPGSFAFKVGPGPSHAQLRLEDVAAVRRFLGDLLALVREPAAAASPG